MPPPPTKGSQKLAALLDRLPELALAGATCGDLGCNVGGFTRELLGRGAGRVHAVDKGYGTLAWDLRNDPRVVVRERENALFLDDLSGLDLVVSDLAWTRQALVLPRAFRYVRPGGAVLSLLKPQYEAAAPGGRAKPLLADDEGAAVAARVAAENPAPAGWRGALLESPVRGGRGGRGNLEWWLVFLPVKTER